MCTLLSKCTPHLTRHLDVSRPDRLSSAEISSIAQAAGLQGQLIFHGSSSILISLVVPIAVRKNRYVILPVDFEEAWKVSCLYLFGLM